MSKTAEIETFEQQLAFLGVAASETAAQAVPEGRKDSGAVQQAKNASEITWSKVSSLLLLK